MSQRKAKMQRREEAARNSLPQAIKTFDNTLAGIEQDVRKLGEDVLGLLMLHDALIQTLESKGLVKREELEQLANELAEKHISALEESKHESGR